MLNNDMTLTAFESYLFIDLYTFQDLYSHGWIDIIESTLSFSAFLALSED